MSTTINLAQYRKAKVRRDKARKAEKNAARHGISKAQRRLDAARAEKAARELSGHERE